MTDQIRLFSTGRPALRAFAAALAVMLALPAGPAQAIPLARAPAMTTESSLVEVQYVQRRATRRRAPVRRARRGGGNALAAVAIGAMVLGVTAAIAADRRRERRERRAYRYGYGYQPYQPAYVAAPVYGYPRHRSRRVYHSQRAYPGAPVVRHRLPPSPFAGPPHHLGRGHWRQY